MAGLATVINAIPRTNQTDPAKFPAYEYQPYPCQVKDRKTGKPYIDKETNQIANVTDEDHEREYLAAHPDAMIKRGSDMPTPAQIDAQAAENAALKARIAELEGVQHAPVSAAPGAALVAPAPAIAPKKPGRPTAEAKMQAKIAAAEKELADMKAKAAKPAAKTRITPVIPLRGGDDLPPNLD